VKFTRQGNPTTGEDYLQAVPHFTANVEESLRSGRFLVWERGDRVAMSSAHAAPIVVAVGRLGLGGAITPLDGIVVDTYGLANPLGARITRTQPGATGHEKNLPWEWVLADFAEQSVAMGFAPERIEAARRALGCGALAELLASVREPLTAARFWDNLLGSVRRTRLVIPADPIEAERAFCRP
jgi:arabinofuranosyltransferase